MLPDETKEELKECYYIRDGFRHELQSLMTDRMCLPIPRKLLELFEKELNIAIECIEAIRGNLDKAYINTGSLSTTEEPTGIQAEHLFKNLTSRLPLSQMKALAKTFDKLFDPSYDEYLLGKAQEYQIRINEIKAAQQANTPEAIVAKIKAGGFTQEFLDELIKELEQRKAEKDDAK